MDSKMAADNCHQCKSGEMGGGARWTAAIMMDGSGVIAMDHGSGYGQQWQRNWQWDSRAIAMGDEMVAG